MIFRIFKIIDCRLTYRRIIIGYPEAAVIVSSYSPTVLAQPCTVSGRSSPEIGSRVVIVPAYAGNGVSCKSVHITVCCRCIFVEIISVIAESDMYSNAAVEELLDRRIHLLCI